MRDLRQRGDLVAAIDRAGLARLRDRHGGRDHLMRAVAAVTGERGAERAGGDLAVGAVEPDELQSAAEKFHCAAFVGRDVRLRVTEHDAPGRGDLRQRQRVGRGPGRHQEHRHVALENLGKAPLDRRGPSVIAVAARIAVVRLRDGVENRGRDRRGIVAGEVHGQTRSGHDGGECRSYGAAARVRSMRAQSGSKRTRRYCIPAPRGMQALPARPLASSSPGARCTFVAAARIGDAGRAAAIARVRIS